MNTLKRSLLASVLLGAALPAFAATDLPFIVTGVVRDAADGTSAAGMRWTAWRDAAPQLRYSGRVGDEIVGAVRPGAFYGDIGSAAAAAGGQWTVLVQGVRRGRTYAAIAHGSLASHPAVFTPATLSVLPRTVLGVDLSRLGNGFRPHGNGGSVVVGGPGEMLDNGNRIRRANGRAAGQPLSLCDRAGGTEVVAEASADVTCLPLLRSAPSVGSLPR